MANKKISELTLLTTPLGTDETVVNRSGLNGKITLSSIIANLAIPNSRAVNTSLPLTGGGALSSDLTLSIQNAGADGVTKGAATFNAADFNGVLGLISIDYVNGQSASASTKGFLTSTDWTTFNNKGTVTSVQLVAGTGISLSGTNPITSSGTITITNTQPAPTSISTVQHNVKYGVALTKGQAVYVSSADGTNMIVSKADYSVEATSSKTMGLVTEDGALNHQGAVVTEGLLSGIDTSAAGSAGDPVWLGDDGNLLFGLANKPVAPNHMVFIGIVTKKNASTGEIFVKVQNGYELHELHDVSLPSYVSNGVLYRDTVNNLWKTASIDTVLGYTPENQANKATTFTTINDILYPTVKAVNDHIDSKITGLWDDRGSYNASTNLYPSTGGSGTGGAILKGDIWTVNVQGTLGGVVVHIGDTVRALVDSPGQTSANWALLENNLGYVPANVLTTISTSAPLSGGGDLSANRTLSISQATSSTNGYLSSTDWNTFNNKTGGSGTFNYVSKFTSSGIIGNSSIQDNGTGISLGGATFGVNNSYKLRVPTNDPTQYGIFIEAQGNAKAGISSNTGGTNAAATTIAGEFIASGAGTKYAVKLTDGTEAIGKFLKSVDTDGKANWSTITSSDVSGVQATITLTTTGTSGAATFVGNTLNIPQYSAGASVAGNADYLYLYNNFK